MMLGKTNILFVSKSDASEVQLIQERYLTPSSGSVIKIEYLNNMFFVYTSTREVMYGADMGALAYIRKDGKNLEATHFIYHEGKYYFCDAYEGSKLKSYVYATSDFTDYEEIILEEYEDEAYDLFSAGIFKDSQERIIVIGYRYKKTGSSTYDSQSRLHILYSFGERQDEEIIGGENGLSIGFYAGKPSTEERLIKDRIFTSGSAENICDLAGNVSNYTKNIESYANDYFYTESTRVNYYGETVFGIYKSFDGINWSLCTSAAIKDISKWTDSESIEVIPLAGKTCLIYKAFEKIHINLADRPEMIGNPTNETFDLDISDFSKIYAVAEDGEGNTYIGFKGGNIIKLYLDQDGTTKLPDVQLVKTLAAKQALAQAKQYTDEKVAELKAYVDSKIEQNAEDNMGQQ